MIALEGVTYRYPGAVRPALSDVTLRIEPGELVVVAGGTGSGKSTLLRAISGLVPHFHGGEFGGVAEIVGRDTRRSGPGELAAEVGSLFQDPETQVVMGTVRAELAFPLENRGWSEPEVARGVEEVALALAIDQLLDRPTGELSGGELQRVALGATLAPRPQVVCLDEPTSQLDPVAGDELIGLLRRLNEDFDLTVILAEHRLERCLASADRVIAMANGAVACDASPEAFLGWAVAEAPELVTPGAKLLAGLGLPPVPGVKRARAVLRQHRPLPEPAPDSEHLLDPQPRKGTQSEVALALDHVWHEIRNGPSILKNVSLSVQAGERIALMGRNGAGKSTLLKHAGGLLKPTRGTVAAHGRVALLLQNPNDYLVHDRVSGETSGAALERFGLGALANQHPRDLSGGERQRLALAIVLGDPASSAEAAAVCLDEPTRGMDRGAKADLASLITGLGVPVLVATHDPEFAAAFATRVILLADGRIVADASPRTLLAGGTYFATETARIIGGAGRVLTPAEAIAMLAPERLEPVLATPRGSQS